jgi:hypothetical protein
MKKLLRIISIATSLFGSEQDDKPAFITKGTFELTGRVNFFTNTMESNASFYRPGKKNKLGSCTSIGLCY